jgi:hypothetical protein
VHRYQPKPGDYGICETCGRDAEWHVMQSYTMIAALRETLRPGAIPSATSETTDEVRSESSVLAQIMGSEWMKREARWGAGTSDMPHPVWYEQVEWDLAVLADKVSIEKLASSYRSMLCDRRTFIDAAYEIHGAALLAGIGQRVDLHVPRDQTEQMSYDVRVEIDGVTVHADCKARRDESPTEPCFEHAERGGSERRASRAVTESTVALQLLESAVMRLPDDGVNLVLFAQVDGSRSHLERALFRRAPVAEHLIHRLTTKLLGPRGRPAEPTVFGDSRFARLSGILWIRLLHLGGPLRPSYNLYVNPNAAVRIPPAVLVALNGEIERRSSE